MRKRPRLRGRAWKSISVKATQTVRAGYARLMYGETKPQARRMMQLAFNRSNSFPRVLVAQSLVGREGLNLHESCRIVVLLHPEWNPGVVEQQIGRVDRVNCRWAKELNRPSMKARQALICPASKFGPLSSKARTTSTIGRFCRNGGTTYGRNYTERRYRHG